MPVGILQRELGFADPSWPMQGRGLGERNDLPCMQAPVHGLQNLLASGEERIARERDQPVGSERGQTGFQQLACLLFVQRQVPGQFQHESAGGGQIGPQLPGRDGIRMHADLLRQLFLRQSCALAQGLERCSKTGRKGLLARHSSSRRLLKMLAARNSETI